ncbi:unnamed protein product [Musa acuminata subsp. malaccensis]|uniref:(wild Malaysian banana) hypothetical protein n=1 Tax=Musa acuminata subsp. malaccensis TaxID=214687 RepID=A0A8D7FD30_MUSAM|nr:unnamed protein product [Musa acuminata subsp. malaccensis]
MGEEMEKQIPSTIPRAYTLTHCDFTANLTLAVSNGMHSQKCLHVILDDVVAEWKKIKEEMSLHVHCYVSGSDILQDLVAGFRYHIFSKELLVVLKAVVHLYMEILSYLGSTLSCWKLRYGCTSIQD